MVSGGRRGSIVLAGESKGSSSHSGEWRDSSVLTGASSLLHLGRAALGQRENTETVAKLPQPAQPRYHARQGAHTTNKISIHANFHVCFNFCFHHNALFVPITISNTRSKRVNENITRQCTRQEENMYTCKFSCLLEFRLLRYCSSTGRRSRRR